MSHPAMLQFENPGTLWVLVGLVPFLFFWTRKSYADLPASRAWLAFGMRTVGLLALLFALARPVLLLENSDHEVLYLVDVSDSVSDASLEATFERIAEETADLERGERAGLVLFAGRPRMLRTPGRDALDVTAEGLESLREKIFHRRALEEARGQLRAAERGEAPPVDAGSEEGAEASPGNVEDRLAALEERVSGLEAWRSELSIDETNLEAACRLARGSLSMESRRRLVLCSDGNENRGEVLRELRQLERSDIELVAWEAQESTEPEVMAERLVLPAEVKIHAPFDLELLVTSNIETEAEVRFYRNKYLLPREDGRVKLVPGRNRVAVPRLVLEEGFHDFEAVVAPLEDTVLENNVVRGAVRVEGRPRVLLVDSDGSTARYLEDALSKEEIQVEVRPEGGVPEDLNDLLNYDVLMLSDVPADGMSVRQMEMIKRYVRDMGGGLVMLGGEQSFGLGGYYKTPIEDVLPVKMPVRKNIEKPNLELILVIDKSGSMGGEKIQLAKEAAIASAEVLKESDNFGVIAFDSLSEWICHPTSAQDLDSIVNDVARLIAGGGTHIYPALYEAYEALLDSDAKLRHIILLSDGHTTGEGYRELVSHIAADEITLSTVGIGDSCDVDLLESMARLAGGEYYQTSDFGSVPQIFTRETLRASKAMLVEEPFVPRVVQEVDALKGIRADDVPFLLGYVATQLKNTATLGMVSDYDDPILAQWNCGLGRAAAFTSDARPRWAGDWISWEAYSKFWAQLVRSVMSTGAHRELRPQNRIEILDGQVRVTVDVRDRRGEFVADVRPEISRLEAGRDPSPLEVESLGTGLYRAEFPLEEYGEFHRLMVVQKQGEEVLDLSTLAVTRSYSPEYEDPLPDEALLRRLAEETGGRFAPEAGTSFDFEGPAGRTPKDTFWWWLLLAAVLLPLDIALRRLGG